jgi:L-malate glycosyltransferase
VGADRSYLPITRFSIEKSDGVTAVSQYLQEATYRTFGVRNQIEVIHNFVNCDIFKPSNRSDLRARFAPDGQKILIHLSNFRPVKRPVDVVDVFAMVQSKLPAVLLMVGDGPERSNAEWRARDHGIEKSVHFLGKRSDIEDLMSSADLLLLPSENESFGLAALEAMACEVPVVVSNVGGLPEVITNGVEGYLVEPRNVRGMADRAIEILADPALRSEMGKRARKSARERFCASRIIPIYESYYRKILASS